MKIFIYLALSSICTMSFASPAQEKTIDEFFKVSDLKKLTFDSLRDQDLALFGKTKESFWQQFQPEVKKIYQQVLTEEELLASIKFYKTPEGRSLLEKTPQLIKLSADASMKIIYDQETLDLINEMRNKPE